MMIGKFRYILNGFKQNSIRTLLTIFSVSIGSMSLIVVSLISTCGKDALNNELDMLGLDGLIVTSKAKDIDKVALSEIESVDGVRDIAAIYMKKSSYNIRSTNGSCYIWGIDENINNVLSMDVKWGRPIKKNDIVSNNEVCLIDSEIAKNVYKRENIVGKKISVEIQNVKHDLEIIGVVDNENSLLKNIVSDYIPCSVYVPISLTSDSEIGYDKLAVSVKNGFNPELVGDEIVDKLTISDEGKKITAENLAKQRNVITDLADTVTIIFTAMGSLAMLVAGISITTLMSVTVNERTREIGIKKSLGADNSTILKEFIAETFLITVSGIILGSISGVTIGYLILNYYNLNVIIDLRNILTMLFMALLSGVLFGIMPAVRASKLKPVDALRNTN